MGRLLKAARKTRGNSSPIQGFSLIEAVAALLVLAVLIHLASLSFGRFAPEYRLRSAAWEISSRLNYARYKALFEGVPVRLRFGPTGYAVEKYDEEKKTWKVKSRHFLEGVHVQANNIPTFHPGGTVSNLVTILVNNSRGTYKITLAISGRIKAVRL